MLILLYLSSGLFLGWSLGANDAADIFGTAVGSKMVRFRTAAIISSLCIILGAWISGRGASHTLEQLGEINQLGGAFIVALTAGATVYWMTMLKLPVSSSQSIVGAIIGWNIFTGSLTDTDTFKTIAATWVICPVLAAVFSMGLYVAVRRIIMKSKMHLIKLDFYNRIGLILVGAFGAYSLGANNISNVMGVFVPVFPFKPLDLWAVRLSSAEQLFLLGGIAISIGIFTYSHKVISTVGEGIVDLKPLSAFTVVLASSLVLFLFSSQEIQQFLAGNNLPTIPLVPVSSSQAIVGAVIGIGIIHGGRGINYKLLGKIGLGWMVTPLIACTMSFIALFIFQNVFSQRVFRPVEYAVTEEARDRLSSEKIPARLIDTVSGRNYANAAAFRDALKEKDPALSPETIGTIIRFTRIQEIVVSTGLVPAELRTPGWLTPGEADALRKINGMKFHHSWQMEEALAEKSAEWVLKPDRAEFRPYNKRLRDRLRYLVSKMALYETAGDQ